LTTARIAITGTGGVGVGSGSLTSTIATVPTGVVETDVALVIATWQATALEVPPTSTMFGGTGWTTLVAPRTDGTMGWAVYAARGLGAGDLVVHQLASARAVQLYDLYLRGAAAPASWVAGAVTARSANVATTLAAGMALAALASQTSELNLAISVERTTATGTTVTSAPGATTAYFLETANGTNLTSAWVGALPGLSTPSSDVTITHNSGSANGAALQLAIPDLAAVVPTPGLYRPNSELVAVAWLKGISYLGTRVATELPRSLSGWSASGFVVVAAAGGTGVQYTPMRRPVVDVQTVAVAPESGKPPWGQSSQMAEQIVAATLDHPTVPRLVSMPTGYRSAFVRSVWVANEPRRVPGDAGDFARFSMDLAFDWVEVPS
jgi:hypothetical protein